MIKLSSVKVNKYKSIINKQIVSIEEDVTTFVGMNEAGKTAFLESLAKFNYFENDPKFKFDVTLDYPRKELKKFQSSDDIVNIVECEYTISDDLIETINEGLGENVFSAKNFTLSCTYDDSTKTVTNIISNLNNFLENLILKFEIDEKEKESILETVNLKLISNLLNEDSSEKLRDLVNYVNMEIVEKYNDDWHDPLSRYIYFEYIQSKIPKFWYYDEYFNLDSRVNLTLLKNGTLSDDSTKTARALLDVAKIDLDDILLAKDFENFIAELEATSNEITDQIFEYWTANKNLEIVFKDDRQADGLYLDIRIKNNNHRVTIPLNQRSKGFNWFFSFIVWFSKIKNDKNNKYILLLDEPGLNLHASAQKDLLRFIEDLSKDYQIIYTTHSPFMVDSTKIHRVRTVYEGIDGTKISDSIQEKDSRTLFPLQAALGYDLAQNLFVASKNLLVEGPADLLYLTKMSEYLKELGMEGLKEDIIIVPIGGLDKVPAFISLMIGNKLDMVALLDSFTNPKGKQKLDDMITKKIIKDKNIRFYDEFIDKDKADVEDLFEPTEYLKYFNNAFNDYQNIDSAAIENKNGQIIPQINKIIGRKYNHYLPAKEFMKENLIKTSLSDTTKLNFERLFKTINSLI